MTYNCMSLFGKLFQFVLLQSAKYNIDESHSVGHSMNVLHYSHEILNSELELHKYLLKDEKLIYISAIIHDMCDKKYVNVDNGLEDIQHFLKDKVSSDELEASKKIISTMSYSYVKKNGFPDLGLYQPAYHIVREADLLSAYDFDRSVYYHLYRTTNNIEEAFSNANDLFQNRVFRHNDDGLFLTDYSKIKSVELEGIAHKRIISWRKMLKI